MKRVLLATIAIAAAQADRLEPRPKPSEYSQQAKLPKATLAAEFLAHSYSGEGRMFFTEEYFVIEVAIYPEKGETIELNNSQFQLRLNGKKQTLFPQNPEMAAASIKYSDWVNRPHVEATAGVGDDTVTVGRPRPQQGPFPGGGPNQTPMPRAPEPDYKNQGERKAPQSPGDVVKETALEQGPHKAPVAGHLYFPYAGKAKSLKSIELLYNGPAGEAVLKFK